MLEYVNVKKMHKRNKVDQIQAVAYCGLCCSESSDIPLGTGWTSPKVEHFSRIQKAATIFLASLSNIDCGKGI